MKINHWILGYFLFLSASSIAQQTKLGLGLGAQYNAFQDTRFSDIQYYKMSVFPELYFSRTSEKNIIQANAYLYAFKDHFPGLDTAEISTWGCQVNASYLHHIKKFYLGGTWTLIDYYTRDNAIMNNSKNFYKNSSDIMISAQYPYSINDKWKLNMGIDYGLLSFVNTAPSFSVNFPQNVVNNGQVSFMDAETRDPFAYKYMTPMFFWEQVLLKTRIAVQYGNRLEAEYRWDMRSWADNKGYPVTIANHQVLLKYNILNHRKK